MKFITIGVYIRKAESIIISCIDLNINKIDKNKCIHGFEKQYKNQNETIEYIQMNQIKVMNSGIRVN